MSNQTKTQQSPQQPLSFVIQQDISTVSFRLNDLANAITKAFQTIVAEKDKEINDLKAQLLALQVPVKEKQP